MINWIKSNKEFIKSIIIVLLTEATLYFIIENSIRTFHLITPRIEIPLIKEFVYIYNSWYPSLFLLGFLLYKTDKETYKKFIFISIIGIILSELTFIIYPTMIIRPTIEINTLTDKILYFTYYFDTPSVNCIPSVHCLLCFISIYSCIINKNIKTKLKLPIIIFYILIILSTVFIKQHLIIDAIIALIYSIIGIIIVNLFYPKLKRVLKFIF